MYTPVKMKRSMKYGNNYWETYSPKINRNVKFFSDLEYDNWLHIETNPNIINFCEQPLKIEIYFEGKLVTSVFDMWVLYKDNTEEFMEVKYASELEGTSLKSLRSIRQTTIQSQWCLKNNYKYSIRTDKELRKSLGYLNNLKQIIGQVKGMPNPNKYDLSIIINQVSNGPISIDTLISLTNFSMAYVIQMICWLLYKGICQAKYLDTELNLQTEVDLIAEE